MSVESTHPDYDANRDDWQMMRDAMAGERAIKERAEVYLDCPEGFKQMAEPRRAYAAYLKRAEFPEFLAPTVRGMSGIICRVEAAIKLPKKLAGMTEKATRDGDAIETLHRRIVRELLTTGRYSLLTDMPSDAKPDDLPYLVGVNAEHLINWSADRDFYVIDECKLERQGYTWVDVDRHRVLELVNGRYEATVHSGGADAGDPDSTVPQMVGGKTFDEIPLVVMGAVDVGVDVGEIPLKGVARAAIAAYRLDADYRYQLYMSGQETLFVTGVSAAERPSLLGAGVIVSLPLEATATYVGPRGSGIAAHRTAIADEADNAARAGARLFSDRPKSGVESGDALKLRFAGETATLTSISQSAAQGLERALKWAAQFVGADPDEVVVTPNLSFVDATLSASDALALVQVWQTGAISKQTLYDNLQRGEIASSERTLEEEEALIEDEMPPPATGPTADANSIDHPPTDQQLNAFRAGQKPPSRRAGPPRSRRARQRGIQSDAA